jgi:hypothetical protein
MKKRCVFEAANLKEGNMTWGMVVSLQITIIGCTMWIVAAIGNIK